MLARLHADFYLCWPSALWYTLCQAAGHGLAIASAGHAIAAYKAHLEATPGEHVPPAEVRRIVDMLEQVELLVERF